MSYALVEGVRLVDGNKHCSASHSAHCHHYPIQEMEGNPHYLRAGIRCPSSGKESRYSEGISSAEETYELG